MEPECRLAYKNGTAICSLHKIRLEDNIELECVPLSTIYPRKNIALHCPESGIVLKEF